MIKNCDTFFRNLSLRVGRRKKLSRRLSSADVALDSEADLHSCFEAQQDDTGQTRLEMSRDDCASRRGVAVMRAAPLLKAGAISRSAQYIC